MITGFRWHLGGGQACYGVEPDLSTFGKALGNGFSISALVGKRSFLELGGLNHDNRRVFLLSTTHGSETHSMAAAMAVMSIYERQGVIDYLYKQGDALADGVRQSVEEHHLADHFTVLGRPCNLIYATRDENKQPSQAYRALFLQEMIRRGILVPSMVVSFSHTDSDIQRTIEAVDESLAVYRKALEDGVDKYLIGRPVKPVFRAYN
jgi:glutamate-1-semialdehyde 2,1-aminomutase